MALTAKQAAFVQEYLIDLNGTQAAIRAGFSAKTAEQQAFQLLKKTLVAEAIQAAMAKRSRRTEITQDRVLRELAKIGFSDIADVVSWGQREVAFGFDDEGRKLPASELGDAVVVTHEFAPFVTPINSDDLSEDIRSSVSEVALTKDGLKIKMHDKRGALVDLGRHLGLFTDNLNVSGNLVVTEGGVSGLLSAVKNAKAATVESGS
jgi:phage terminase small subunit